MDTASVLIDAFARIREEVHDTVRGLTADQLGYQLDEGTNSICWLVWHLTRIQDDHVADAAGWPQVWTEAGWADRFGLPFGPAETGYGHKPAEVAAVRAGPELLTGYYDAVHEQTIRFVRDLSDADLDRVVDTRWNPPVTLGVRLVSVIADDLQHAGQAALVRGIVGRR